MGQTYVNSQERKMIWRPKLFVAFILGAALASCIWGMIFVSTVFVLPLVLTSVITATLIAVWAVKEWS